MGIVGVVAWGIRIAARFTLRESLVQHYNTAEPLGLRLSGVMTFFFGNLYFTYHIKPPDGDQAGHAVPQLWYVVSMLPPSKFIATQSRSCNACAGRRPSGSDHARGDAAPLSAGAIQLLPTVPHPSLSAHRLPRLRRHSRPGSSAPRTPADALHFNPLTTLLLPVVLFYVIAAYLRLLLNQAGLLAAAIHTSLQAALAVTLVFTIVRNL